MLSNGGVYLVCEGMNVVY